MTVGARSIGPAALALALALTAAVLAAGCDERKRVREGNDDVAARVNNGEVTLPEINLVLQQRNVRAEQADAAGRQVLERLIDQELAVQQALGQGLEREPRVRQQLEAARRDVLSRAYAEKAVEAVAAPTAEEVRRYYEAHPELFAQRKVWSLDELLVEVPADRFDAVRAQLAQARSSSALVEQWRADGLRVAANQSVRAAEQLPAALLSRLAPLQAGQSLLIAVPQGAQVLWVSAVRVQPLALEQASAAIEQALLLERRRTLVDANLKALRAAARIEYRGRFASDRAAQGQPAIEDAASAAGNGTATAPVPAAAAASSAAASAALR